MRDIGRGQRWRLVTPGLVNPAPSGPGLAAGAVNHFVVNAVGLVILGPQLERRTTWRCWLLIAAMSDLVGETWLTVPYPFGGGYGGGTSIVVSAMAVNSGSWDPGVNHIHAAAFLTGALLGLALPRQGPSQQPLVWVAVILGALSITVATVRTVQYQHHHSTAAGGRLIAPERSRS